MIHNTVDAVFWFRRDLRVEDNHGLYEALKSNNQVLPIFIFDNNILQDLDHPYDKRVQFIYQELLELNHILKPYHTAVQLYFGEPLQILEELKIKFNFKTLYANEDYEPYGMTRDKQVEKMLKEKHVPFVLVQDHVILRPGEVLKNDGTPYTIYTPFMSKWKEIIFQKQVVEYPSQDFLAHLAKLSENSELSLKDLGFEKQNITYPSKTVDDQCIIHYAANRNFPYLEQGCSHLGIHLRFGTISIRNLYHQAKELETTYLNELIWREFFIHILYFHPQVVSLCFKPAYEKIQWRNNPKEFSAWCSGHTGYALVDAGMRELNKTGYMHNRVRMVVASFLCKHLLIDWRWGEAYFAQKLLDYELASNNGNWQWAAGTGCDAAPYFRIFNPHEQLKKFDPHQRYVFKWAPEYNSIQLPPMIVDHAEARERALKTYKDALKQ